jgi:hypothetical protein
MEMSTPLKKARRNSPITDKRTKMKDLKLTNDSIFPPEIKVTWALKKDKKREIF